MDSSAEGDASFSVAGGEFTEDEKQYLLRKGLIWENSDGDFFDISTDVEDVNSSRSSSSYSFLSKSRQDSLLLFEENERLSQKPDESLRKCVGSPFVRSRQIFRVDLEQSINLVPASQIDLEEEEDEFENKENEVPKRQIISNCEVIKGYVKMNKLFADESFENDSASGIAVETSVSEYGEKSTCGELSRLDKSYVVPCTQDMSFENESNMIDNDSVNNTDFVLGTQDPYAEDVSMTETNVEIVSCTQKPFGEESYQSDISSIPSSQESTANSTTSSGKEDLDDTITTMTKLLALADEQEAKEKLAAESVNDKAESSTKLNLSEKAYKDPSQDQNNAAKNTDIVFKTPLKHVRVQLLKNRKLCTPSPPRTFATNILQRGAVNKGVVIAANSKSQPLVSAPSSTSTPKRTPLAVVTPQKKPTTPKNVKTPVTAKVDSGLRPFPIGLSPVADYIHSKAVPSKFVRVQGIPSHTSNSSFNSQSSSMTRIPMPPRVSQAQVKQITPSSTSKEPRHSVLRTTTFFDMNKTPPAIIKNEAKRFQPMQYTGPSKVKSVNGSFNSAREEYVAHRHTGLRDDSGNASFIQNTLIQKRFIPQSKLATPPSYCRK